MIRDGHGINVEVRRSLRDIFRKVPILCMKVQVMNLVFSYSVPYNLIWSPLFCCLIATFYLVTIISYLNANLLFVACSFNIFFCFAACITYQLVFTILRFVKKKKETNASPCFIIKMWMLLRIEEMKIYYYEFKST